MIRTHTVVAGETLHALALRFYGDAELDRLIATASGIANPNAITVGQRLAFPDYRDTPLPPGTRCRSWRRVSTVMTTSID